VPVWGIEEQLDAILGYALGACRALLTIAPSAIRWKLRRHGSFELSQTIAGMKAGLEPRRLAVHRTGTTQTWL
jgi:hypothetical protein